MKITALFHVNKLEEFHLVMRLEWREDESIDIFEDIFLPVDLRPVEESRVMLHRREYKETWRPIRCTQFLDVVGLMRKTNKLLDIYFDDEKGGSGNDGDYPQGAELKHYTPITKVSE